MNIASPKSRIAAALACVLACGVALGGRAALQDPAAASKARGESRQPSRPPVPSALVRRIIAAAEAQTGYTNIYDPSYRALAYPNGDLPRERGVCTDVIVRAFRDGAGIDLQKEIHEDMLRNFSAYPQRYGLRRPDPNIDHRRVPNLMTYFQREGKAMAISRSPADYWPGDIVAWDLGGGVLHIGIVSDSWSTATNRYEIIHNIGAGARKEDRLFDWRIVAHYRY